MNKLIKGIVHCGYNVSNIDKSLEFYCDKLGFEKHFTMELESGKKIDYIKVNKTNFIELFYGQGVTGGKNEGSYDHICLEVSDLEKLKTELEAKGVEIDVPINMGLDNNYQFWIHDPDGNRIEFMQYGKGALQFAKH